jgi:Tfp pilus assembly protein PilE
METKDIIGLTVAVALLGSSAFNSYQNDYLKNKVINLETLALQNKAIFEGKVVKEKVYKELTDKIEKEHNEEVNDINRTAIGDTIEF